MSTAESGSEPQKTDLERLPHQAPIYARPMEGEKAKHFALFSRWLELDPPVRATPTGAEARKAMAVVWGGRMPGESTVAKLAREYRWEDRARAYEADRAEQRLKATGEDSVWDRVRAYRHRQQRISAASLEASISALNIVVARLKTIKPEELAVRDIPPYLNSIRQLQEMMSSAEAQAIGLTELMQSVEELQHRAQKLAEGGYRQAKGEA